MTPPSVWASNINNLHRTTNACESFHARFDDSFYHSHPDIFKFVNVLLDFQTEIYVKIRTANMFQKKIRKDVKLKHDLINRNINEYNSNLISRWTFVKKVCYKNLPF